MRTVLAILLTAAVAGCGDSGPSAPAGTVVADSLARFPTIALQHDGTALVAWTSAGDGATNVYLASVVDGTAGAAVRVNDVPGDAATHGQAPAQVAVAHDGTVYVAWISQRDTPGRRFPATDLRLARSDDGGRSFAPAVTVNDDGGFRSGHHFHDVAVAPDGAVFVSWLDTRVRDAARAGAAGGDGAGDAHRAAHDEARTREGHDHAAGADAGTEVRVARSDDGGRTFGPSTVIASGSCECCRTRLAFTRDGAVLVAWRHQFEADVRDPAVARSDDGGRTFGAPVRVGRDAWRISGCPHSGPAVAVDASGRVHLAWYTGAEGRAGLYHAISADGGATFGDPVAVAPSVPGTTPALAGDGAGGAWLAWEDRRAGVTRVAHVGAEGSLAPGEPVAGATPALAPARRPALVVVDGGRVAMVGR